jgi:hypothetical protein
MATARALNVYNVDNLRDREAKKVLFLKLFLPTALQHEPFDQY